MDIFERWFEQDLTKKVGIQHAESVAFSGNNESNIVGVYVYKDGAPAVLNGTVTGTVIRPDGMTVPLTGTLNGNAVSAVLTEACFAVPGYIGVALTVTSGDITMTVLKATFEVEPIETGTVVDPSGEITANVAELISDIEAAVAAIPPSYSDLLAAVAPVFDPEASTPYQSGAYVWYSGALYRFIADHTGAWTGTDVVSVNVGEEISELKGAITNGYQSITTLVNGGFNVNGNLNVRSDRLREETFIHVKSGDKIIIDAGTLKYAVGAWNGTPSTETNVRNDNTFRENGETIVSDFDGYYIIVFAKQTISSTITPSDFDGEIRVYSGEIYNNTQRIAETNARVDELSDEIEEIEQITGGVIADVHVPIYIDTQVPASMTTGACLNNGTIRTDYDTYQYTQKISVSPGDVVTPISSFDDPYFRWVCAYNGNSAVASAGKTNAVVSYTVPDGIDGVVATTQISKSVSALNIKHQTGTEDKVYLIHQELGKTNWKGSISNGSTVELLPSNVRYNVAWCFTGHVSTMGKIIIGIKTPSGTVKELCAVDATYIYYRLNDGNIASEAHGITIGEDLQIKIESPFKVNELDNITICSDGTEYTLSATAYGTDMTGCPYLVSDGAEMTDCAFTWIPQDIAKPIWIFGDSWVSMYDTRWPYYMVRNGFANTWMLNGFAGEDTDEAYESLENLLTIRKPDYIVWMLGMNNGDSSTAVNSVWKEIYDKLVQLCNDYGINLILYTVPNTPTINNNFKNEIVRSSGYRYIDGAAAVGDNGSGVWFDGYWQSASDKNHTSAKGARALYYRILTDFPEIAGNGV